ncbi:hypothetical protein [Actinokineospora globicatena]|uniref:hypothetical protein n=1 Tax=Actinokineospora globicatena TaxID=103729 RepID=UPI0020A33D85|nr:hypothetical protein [Actinokineospora globicatena]GLW80358.1 hypothetical protein Aglo01_48390 [Actinokineospora globicatena]GLW87186.1 hypothetical protein Aglo02_48250 [Actinokineospora globicatena]
METLVGRVAGMAKHVWWATRPVGAAQVLLWWCGALLLASAAVHGVVALVDGGPWLGSVTWRKPVVFGASFGLVTWSSVWVMRQLPRRWFSWPFALVFGLSSLIEVGLITLQKWRGAPSHFNSATPFDEAVFSGMGITVLLVAAATGFLLVWAVLDFRGTAVSRVAALAGLLALAVAGYVGTDLIAAGDQVYATTGHVPEDLVFGAAGSAKLAHAIGIHGIQVLIVLAVLLEGAAMATRTRLWTMLVGTAGYAAVYTAVTVTAYAGRAWTDPVLPVAVLGLVGVVGVGVGFWQALVARGVADDRSAVAV